MGMTEDTFIADGSSFCKRHKSRDALMERAKDLLTHGIYAQSIQHVFDKLPAWQQLQGVGFYDAYLVESQFDFDARMEAYEIDTDGLSEVFDTDALGGMGVDTDGDVLPVEIPVPTEHETRAWALFRAAVMDVKAQSAERELLSGDTTAMEREQVVDVTEHGKPIFDEDEHHLNLPLSRIDKDKDELLAYGGVPVDSNADVDVSVGGPEELIVDLESGGPRGEEPAVTTTEENPVHEAAMEAVDDGLETALPEADVEADADEDS